MQAPYYKQCDPRLAGRKKGEVQRFMSIKNGDIILVPCPRGFYIGISNGKRKYDDNSKNDDLANQIEITFIERNNEPAFFARDGKLNALSTKLGARGFTVLQILQEDIINEIERIRKGVDDVSLSDTVAKLESEAESKIRSTLPEIISNYSNNALEAQGRGFEQLIAKLLETDGYETQVLDKKIGGKDIADADILAIKKSLLGNAFSQVLFIQAKHHIGTSGSHGLKQIIAIREKINVHLIEEPEYIMGVPVPSEQIVYILVSSGEFDEKTKAEAIRENIVLIDGEQLSEMLFNMMDQIPEVRHQLGVFRQYGHINKGL